MKLLALSLLLASSVSQATICKKFEKYYGHTNLPDQVCFDITGDKLTGTILRDGQVLAAITGSVSIQPESFTYNKHTGESIRIAPYNQAYFYTKSPDAYYSGYLNGPEDEDVRGEIEIHDDVFGATVFKLRSCPGKYEGVNPFCKK
jgi:hypothetical protein